MANITATAPKRRIKKGKIHEGNPIATVIMYAIAVLTSIICVYPIYYVAIMSISTPHAINTGLVWVWPDAFNLDTYKIIVDDSAIWTAYGNTIIYVVGSVLLMLTTCLLAGYPLTCRNLIGRKLITVYIMIPMYFGAGVIHVYLHMRSYGMINNPFVMFLTHGYSMWYIILTRTYLLSIPDALRDSAKIDGANHFRTLFNIFMPLAKPIIAVIAIYTVINVWNGWMTASLYLTNLDYQPLQLYLRRVLVTAKGDLGVANSPSEAAKLAEMEYNAAGLQYALIVFTTAPVLAVYPFFQKYFVKGTMVGSVKG